MDQYSDYTCDIKVTVDGETLSDYDLILRNAQPHAVRFAIDAGVVHIVETLVESIPSERVSVGIYSTQNANSAYHAYGILADKTGTGPLTIEWVPSYNVEMWAPPLLGNTGTDGKVNIGWDKDTGLWIENRTRDIIVGIVWITAETVAAPTSTLGEATPGGAAGTALFKVTSADYDSIYRRIQFSTDIDGTELVIGEDNAFLVAGGTLTRSNKQRWSDVVNVLDKGADPTGVADCSAAFSAAITEALSRGLQAKVIFPPGRFRISNPVNIIQTDTTKHLLIEGAGSRACTLVGNAGIVDLIRIGARGNTVSTKTANIGIRGFRITAPSTHAGAAFDLRNAKDIEFGDILFDGCRNGWELGVGDFDNDGTPDFSDTGSVDTINPNDVTFVRIINCGGDLLNSLGGTMITLGSAAGVQVAGDAHRWNSAGGTYFIKQIDPNNNIDGLYVTDMFGADFISYLELIGDGGGNIVWIGGQMDGGTGAVILRPTSGGNFRGGIFANISVRNIGGTWLTLDASASGVSGNGLLVVGNDFNNVDGSIIDAIKGKGLAAGNIIRNGGQLGVPLFKIGAAANLRVRNNFALNDDVAAPTNPYTYGIDSAVPLLPKGDGTNIWENFGVAPTRGTSNLGAPWVIAHSAVLSEVNNEGITTEKTLATIPIPAGAMGANGFLKITLLWSCTASTNNKTLRARLGGVTGTPFLSRAQAGATNISEQAMVFIHNRNSQSSQISFQSTSNGSFQQSTNANQTGVINTAVAQDLVITGQVAVATERCSLEAYIVEAFYQA